MSCLNIAKEQLYEQVKMACRDVVKEKGLDRITVEDLVQVDWQFVTAITPLSQEVAPQGSQLVPDEVKKELLREIRTFLEHQAED